MKNLIAQNLSNVNDRKAFLHNARYSIDCDNWGSGCEAKAKFNIGYDKDNLYLFYQVDEHHVKATRTEINAPVYEDSCVEFFISFDNKHYYNFEFNCIGNVLAQYGTNRNERTFLKESKIKKIVTTPSLGRNKIEIINRLANWSLAVTIPKETFYFSHSDWFQKYDLSCNLYKCGDKLAKPHYLSWNPIKTEKPDFHQIEFFGKMDLAAKNSDEILIKHA